MEAAVARIVVSQIANGFNEEEENNALQYTILGCLMRMELPNYMPVRVTMLTDHHHHHHHVVLVARISLTLSRHFSQSFIASGRSSGQHPVSSHSC